MKKTANLPFAMPYGHVSDDHNEYTFIPSLSLCVSPSGYSTFSILPALFVLLTLVTPSHNSMTLLSLVSKHKLHEVKI